MTIVRQNDPIREKDEAVSLNLTPIGRRRLRVRPRVVCDLGHPSYGKDYTSLAAWEDACLVRCVYDVPPIAEPFHYVDNTSAEETRWKQ